MGDFVAKENGKTDKLNGNILYLMFLYVLADEGLEKMGVRVGVSIMRKGYLKKG